MVHLGYALDSRRHVPAEPPCAIDSFPGTVLVLLFGCGYEVRAAMLGVAPACPADENEQLDSLVTKSSSFTSYIYIRRCLGYHTAEPLLSDTWCITSTQPDKYVRTVLG